MKEQKPKIIVILGPTASGKSDAAIKLAKEFDGEIISADSRQIYRGMNIGTGKVHGTWNVGHEVFVSKDIPHYLIDIVDPNEEFNVSHFKAEAKKALQKIINKENLPIICGGTGFWIQSIVYDLDFPEVLPNQKLREQLSEKSTEELFEQLQELDSQRAANIDPKNKIRLVRAIEIASALGSVPKLMASSFEVQDSRFNFLQIGIDIPKEILDEKIQKRLDERFKAGMIEEVERLHLQGLSWEKLEAFGLEYRWIARFLQGKISEEEMREKLYFDIIHYAKRQITWFKKDKNIKWVKSYDEIEKEVQKFLKK